MKAAARLDPRAAAFLLSAAALLDLVVVFFLLQLTGSLFEAILLQTTPGTMRSVASLQPEIRTLVELGIGGIGFVALLLVYWLVCEVMLQGRSVGRACLMLSPRRIDGSRPGAMQMGRRAFHKMRSLGLSGLSFAGPDGYDRAAGVVWHSPIAAGRQMSTRNWSLTVLSGSDKGRTYTLGQIRNFVNGGEIRIGRDAAWADIVLDQDELVSQRHARIRLREGRWYINDFGGGSGTPNGTFVDGKRIEKGGVSAFSIRATLAVARVGIKIDKNKR